MNEWLKSLLAAVGGGTVVLVGVFTIFKKLFESGMEASFEKSLENIVADFQDPAELMKYF